MQSFRKDVFARSFVIDILSFHMCKEFVYMKRIFICVYKFFYAHTFHEVLYMQSFRQDGFARSFVIDK